MFDRITIIGLGLIGSSVARAAHEHHLATEIVACDCNEVSLAYAHKHGFVHSTTTNARKSVEGSDLVLIATPPSTLEAVAKAIAPVLKPGCIVMDACSVKLPAIAAIAPHIPAGVHFIPAHPIAGSEHAGVSAGRSDLFERKRVITTPEDPTALEPILQQVTAFWKAMGARVEAMPAHLHDMVYAYVSHLPQLLAFAAGSVIERENASEASVPQKFLRLTQSPHAMWAEIFLLNRENVLQALNRYLDAMVFIQEELSQAPEGTASEHDWQLARTALFPRIAAACLVTTVMEAERKAGFAFARYAGTGFADFTFPASHPPEGDIEHISNQYPAVLEVLEEFVAKLKAMSEAITAEDTKKIL